MRLICALYEAIVINENVNEVSVIHADNAKKIVGTPSPLSLVNKNDKMFFSLYTYMVYLLYYKCFIFVAPQEEWIGLLLSYDSIYRYFFLLDSEDLCK